MNLQKKVYTIFEFGIRQQAECLDPSNDNIPVACVLGSFKYQVKKLSDGSIGIRVDNRTDIGSGTHFAGRHESEGYRGSVENLIASGEISPYTPLPYVLMKHKVISILSPQNISETGMWSGYFLTMGTHELGGGNQEQTYVWKESLDSCPSLDKYLSGEIGQSLEIETWLSYSSHTKSVGW